MGKSVLIVDDSRVSRIIVKRAINDLAEIQHIQEAVNGEAALSLYKESKVDLVLLDLTMEGGMDGFTTLEKIKEIDPQAKVLVISADIQSKSRERVLALGAIDFISKPFNKEKLSELLNNVLNHD